MALANALIFFFSDDRDYRFFCFLVLANDQSTPTLFLKVEKEEELVYCFPIEPEKNNNNNNNNNFLNNDVNLY